MQKEKRFDQRVIQVKCLAHVWAGREDTASACHPLNEGGIRPWGKERGRERKEKHEGLQMKPIKRQNITREHQGLV